MATAATLVRDMLDLHMEISEYRKATPSLNGVHVDRPLGSKDKDDPGTDPEERIAPDPDEGIQDPFDYRNLDEDHIPTVKDEDDPGTQDVDPPNQREIEEAPLDEIVPTTGEESITKVISGSSDIGLNAEGIKLAIRLARRIAAKGCLDIMYSSTLPRGIETVRPILEACPRCIYAEATDALVPWKLGSYEGCEPKDVHSQIVALIEHPDELPPGEGNDGEPGETFNAAKARQLGFFKRVMQDWRDDPTMKIGVQVHSRGQDLFVAWVSDGAPDDYDVDTEDVIDPDDQPHASMMRWAGKDECKEVDLDSDDAFKGGMYLVLHSLTDDDGDSGNPELEKYDPSQTRDDHGRFGSGGDPIHGSGWMTKDGKFIQVAGMYGHAQSAVDNGLGGKDTRTAAYKAIANGNVRILARPDYIAVEADKSAVSVTSHTLDRMAYPDDQHVTVSLGWKQHHEGTLKSAKAYVRGLVIKYDEGQSRDDHGRFGSGGSLYHGTTEERGKSILANGLKVDKSEMLDGSVYAAVSKADAVGYGNSRAAENGDKSFSVAAVDKSHFGLDVFQEVGIAYKDVPPSAVRSVELYHVGDTIPYKVLLNKSDADVVYICITQFAHVSKYDGGQSRDDHGRFGSGQVELGVAQDMHDRLKDHPGRSENASSAAVSSFERGVTALGDKVRSLAAKPAFNVKVNRSGDKARGAILNHADLGDKAHASAHGEGWKTDMALSHYHDALLTASRVLGSKWVGKADNGDHWVTINGNRILIGTDGKPKAGNPKAYSGGLYDPSKRDDAGKWSSKSEQEEYTGGGCSTFACALHELTGFDIVSVNVEDSEDSSNINGLHYAVRVPDGSGLETARAGRPVYMDITGRSTGKQLLDKWKDVTELVGADAYGLRSLGDVSVKDESYKDTRAESSGSITAAKDVAHRMLNSIGYVAKAERVYMPPIEVHRAAKSAWDVGVSVIGITDALAESRGLGLADVQMIADFFAASESATAPNTTRNAYGGVNAAKWAAKVIAKSERVWEPWVGVDFDGTLVQPSQSYDGTAIGKPIKAMVDKVKALFDAGTKVRIFTARVADDPTGKVAEAIKVWCRTHIGQELIVTNEKDPGMTELWDDRAHNPDEIAKAGSGVMIAFMLDTATAKKLAVPGGEDPKDMHVTLAYLGKLDALDMSSLPGLEQAIKGYAAEHAPVSGTIDGPVRFSAKPQTEGRDVCVAAFCNLGIQEFRAGLVDAIKNASVDVPRVFDYRPHVCIKYIPTDAAMPVRRIAPIPVTFNAITLSVGGARKSYPLSGTVVKYSPDQPRDDHGRWGEGVKVEESHPWVKFSTADGNGILEASVKSGMLQVKEANVKESMQGKGLGVRLYAAAFGYARSKGMDMRSDNATSVSADHVWSALARRGFDVERNPLVELDSSLNKFYSVKPMGGLMVRTGEPVWVAHTKSVAKYSPDQPRASDGEWGSGGGRPKSSDRVERARKSCVIIGTKEQGIADRVEATISKGIGVPRTADNSAFDLRSDDVGVEIKTLLSNSHDKITMSKSALSRKLGEAQAEGLKTFTVVADLRGRTNAQYYVTNRLGSLRIGSMTKATLPEIRDMVRNA